MDKGRYRHNHSHNRWDPSSAFDGYGAVRDRDFRPEKPYHGRDLGDGMYSQKGIHSRLSYGNELHDMERYSQASMHEMSYHGRRAQEDGMPSMRGAAGRHDRYGFDGGFDHVDRDSHDHRQGMDHHYGYERNGWSSRHFDGEYDNRSLDDYERDDGFSRNEKRRGYVGHKREREHFNRSRSRDRDRSEEKRRRNDRSRSISYDDYSRSPSRSPRGYSHGRYSRGESTESSHQKFRKEKSRDLDHGHSQNLSKLPPSATLVVKGLSQKTTEDDLYQAMARWGPLKHVRVIKERNSGLSRGFAFVDFPSTEAAQKMMDEIGDHGLIVDGRSLFLEYSSKPTGGAGGPQSGPFSSGSNHGSFKGSLVHDWICNVCGCVNFARRTLCFQCNESRTEDSQPADMVSTGKKSAEPGPTHVLVVRGLDDHIDEQMLHYEFSKHAPIKDLRLVRDKFTHVSRGFAFLHFHSVEEATKVLDATNGLTLEKNGAPLRVAYAKNAVGPASMAPAATQASNLAAAAIEAATFAQQYNSVGWAPKEFNEDGSKSHEENNREATGDVLQSGFVWDETSGYYYDAASGFYYDANSGLYYDSNSGTWCSYDSKTQQYTPCVDQSADASTTVTNNNEAVHEVSEMTHQSEEACTVRSESIQSSSEPDKKPSLPEAVQAAALAAMAAMKKDKEKLKEKEKEIKLASKSSLLANKKKISNVLNKWKQRQNESEAPAVTVNETSQLGNISSAYEKRNAASSSNLVSLSQDTSNVKSNSEAAPSWDSGLTGLHSSTNLSEVSRSFYHTKADDLVTQGVSSSSMLSARIRESINPSSSVHGLSNTLSSGVVQTAAFETSPVASTLRKDVASAGSNAPPTGTKRRFSETPQPVYRDRAAERRSLYASSKPVDDPFDMDLKERAREMPFPPGVGGKGRTPDVPYPTSGPEYEVITRDKAIDQSNIGNRMLRNMGWQEGSGLGKDRTGIVEPVQAQSMGDRSGLGSQVQQRKVDPRFEAQPGDSYKVVIQKKALARFHEMS